jgi:signal transduction histidine kinase
MMTSILQRRLGGLALAILTAAVLIGWAAQTSWRRVEELNDNLSREPIESFRTADRFRAALEELESLRLSHQLRRQDGDWDRFLAEQKKLDNWIDEQDRRLTTEPERQVLQQINSAYDEYTSAARTVREAIVRGTEPSQVEGLAHEARQKFESLGALGTRLLEAHQQALNDFVADSRRALTTLRTLLFAALVVLLALGAGMAVVVYRELIKPLRLQLVESRDIIAGQEKLASLGVLAAGVAHEIRNPLTAIKARLFTQQKSMAPNSPAAEDARVIGGEISRLERIVRGFLDFARPAEPRPVRLRSLALLKEVQALLGPQLERQQISVTLDTQEDPVIEGDHEQLKQVLINLVQNAADAVGGPGRVTLRARTGQQRIRGNLNGVVALEVSDTGPGIPAEVRERLFDPFFTTKANGTGLGLSIAARIAEKHGGALEYQTEIGRGTTFGIVLPQVRS